MFKLYFYGSFFTSICIHVFADQCSYGGVIGPRNNSYYTVNNNPTPWNTAESFCYNKLGHLASSDDAFINSFLASLSVEANEFWLGGYVYGGVWNWTNAWANHTYTPFNYTNWATGEPSTNQPGTCIAINKANGKWRAANCKEQKPYVCQIPKNRQLDSGNCDSNWTPKPNVNKCYHIIGPHETHYNSLSTLCGTAQPLMIQSEGEMDAVQGIIDNDIGGNVYGCEKRYMLGLHDPNNNGAYVWADGTPLNFNGWTTTPWSNPPTGACAFAFTQGENQWIASECEVFGVRVTIICQYTP